MHASALSQAASPPVGVRGFHFCPGSGSLSLRGGWGHGGGWLGGDKSPGATEVTEENSGVISQTVVSLLSDVKPQPTPPPP